MIEPTGSKIDVSISMEDADWQSIYLEYISSQDYGDMARYDWIYVNDDEIPEIVCSSQVEAIGAEVLTITNGSLKVFTSSRLGLQYGENLNVLSNRDGHMGSYYDKYYEITDNGFECIGEGTREEQGGSASPNQEYVYMWNGEQVSESDYNILRNNILNDSTAKDVNCFMFYGEIIELLGGTVESTVPSVPDYSLPTPTPIPAWAVTLDWKTQYKNVVASCGHEGVTFDLVKIDNDVYPELIIQGSSLAEGTYIYTYCEGSVNTLLLGGFGVTYIPESCYFQCEYGHMGTYYRELYQLWAGNFVSVVEGMYCDPNGVPTFDENGEYVYDYYLNGVMVSFEEYQAGFDEVMDSSSMQSVELSYNETSIIQQIDDYVI
ncbi:MAG TPA: hypothetical protein PK567_04125 [Bacillota bacterium]|nr:hypothetical protein [Bacillota bacterium]